MLKYRGATLVRAGFMGVVLAILVIAVGLQPERLIAYATSVQYKALFAEAGGISVGNDVTVSGIKVGAVTDISLDNGDALVDVHDQQQVPTRVGDHRSHQDRHALGERVLTLESEGSGKLNRTEAIPVTRTSSPYSLSDAVGDLTTNTEGTDTARSTSRWTRCRRPSTRSHRGWARRSTASRGCRSR